MSIAPGFAISGATGTLSVYLDSTAGTLTFKLAPETGLPAGVSSIGSISGISNSIAVHLLTTGGTMAVNLGKVDGTVAVYLHSTGGTLGVNVGKIDDNVSVKFATVSGTAGVNIGKVDGTIQVNVGKISDTIAVWLTGTSGTLNVRLADNSAGLITDDTAFTPAVDVGFPAMALFDDTATDVVDEGDAGILRMTLNRVLMVHDDSTASIFTASGTAAGISLSGNTVIAPSANYSFKIYAYAIQTTGVVSLAARFTNGAGTGPTEFWRPFVTPATTTSETRGANLSTAGPGSPLFATGVNTTLSLLLDTATLVHYSVAYTKESA
ncbi:MAG: hypothetical protein AAB875_02530 [Patescibacteria group bacterium]